MKLGKMLSAGEVVEDSAPEETTVAEQASESTAAESVGEGTAGERTVSATAPAPVVLVER